MGYRTGQDRTGQDRAGQDKTDQDKQKAATTASVDPAKINRQLLMQAKSENAAYCRFSCG